MHYVPNTIRRFKLGTVVADTTYDVVTSNGGPDVGHVTGFSTNAVDELIIKVEFAKTGARLIHPANLTVLD